jgi:hypothetical protein
MKPSRRSRHGLEVHFLASVEFSAAGRPEGERRDSGARRSRSQMPKSKGRVWVHCRRPRTDRAPDFRAITVARLGFVIAEVHMTHELFATVRLTVDLPDGWPGGGIVRAGALGAIVEIWADGAAFEIDVGDRTVTAKPEQIEAA